MLFAPTSLTSSNTTVDITPQVEYLTSTILGFGKSISTVFESQIGGILERYAQYENVIMDLSSQYGGGRAYLENFKETVKMAEVQVRAMGGEFGDIRDLQEAANKSIGSITNLTTEGITQLYAASSMVNNGMKVTAENSRQMLENFTKAGTSVYNIGEKVNEIFNIAKQAGVNAKLVYDEVEKNLMRANLFNFKNGVEGMTKMAAQAQMLRVGMEETLNIADNLFDPEKAVEMASVFQRFGMGSLTNVYELQDIARTDPGKLQEMLANEFTRFIEIDRDTGEKRVNAMGQELIRTLSKEVPGLSTDFIIKTGMNMADYQNKLKEIELPSWATDEGLQKLLLQQSQMGQKGTEFEGQYVINVGGQTRAVSSLGAEDEETLRKMLTAQSQGNANIIEAQMSSKDEMMRMTLAINALAGFYPNLIAGNKDLELAINQMGKTLNPLITGILNSPQLFNIKKKQTTSGTVLDPSAAIQSFETKAAFFINALGENVKNTISSFLANPTGAGGVNALSQFSNQLINDMKAILPTDMVDPQKWKDAILGPIQTSLSTLNFAPTSTVGTVLPISTTTPGTTPGTASSISPTTSVVSLIAPTPFVHNHNLNFPNMNPVIEARFKELMNTDPVFMGELADKVGTEMKRQGFFK